MACIKISLYTFNYIYIYILHIKIFVNLLSGTLSFSEGNDRSKWESMCQKVQNVSAGVTEKVKRYHWEHLGASDKVGDGCFISA